MVMIILVSMVVLRIKEFSQQKSNRQVAEIIQLEIENEPVADEEVEVEATREVAEPIGVLISTPESNQLISSPLLVKGKISRTWFFEGQLVLQLIDEDNNSLATGVAVADGDWLNEELVEYVGLLEYDPETIEVESGFLAISKDNPSGLAENQGRIIMPLRFR